MYTRCVDLAPLKLAASSECISLREIGWKSSGEAWLRTNTEEGEVMYMLEQNNLHQLHIHTQYTHSVDWGCLWFNTYMYVCC